MGVLLLHNGEVGTKHVFAGTTRVVSKLVKQDRPNSKRNSENNPDSNGNGNGKARIVYEKDQYYFHPDHLGTTSYITHTNGQVYQHLEYFPFGETWVEEHSNKQRTPYLFTGKELDEGTQLYYFGARYYDPRTSVWGSVDPILGQYLGSNPNRIINNGVYDSRNLSVYSYGFNNPVMMLDPDGNTAVHAARYVAYQGGGRLLARAGFKRAGQAATTTDIAIVGFAGLGLAWGAVTSNSGLVDEMGGFIDDHFGIDRNSPNIVFNEAEGASESSGPSTGNDELDDVLSDAQPNDDGKKGYTLPGSQEDLIGALGDIDGAEQGVRPDGGSTTILPDGTKVDTYPGRTSTQKPGWQVTKPGATRPRIKGDTES